MTRVEAIQWLFENRAKFKLLKLKGDICLKITVEDQLYDESYYCISSLGNASDFLQEHLVPAIISLKELTNG